MTEKISVAEAARRVINVHPFIYDCLKFGLVNFSSLSEFLKKEIEAISGRRNISSESIKMALIRYSEELRQTFKSLEQQVEEVVSNSVLELKNDLSVFTVEEKALIRRISEVYSRIEKYRFFQLTQGTDTFTLIIDEKNKDFVKKLFKEEEIKVLIEDQSAILLSSPETIINTPGVIAFITEVLANNNINITQIISCHTDTIFIVDRKDALKGYELLEKLILGLRERRTRK